MKPPSESSTQKKANAKAQSPKPSRKETLPLNQRLKSCCQTSTCISSADSTAQPTVDTMQPGIVPESQELSRLWIRIVIAFVLGGQAMMLGLAVNTTPPDPYSLAFWITHSLMIISAVVAIFLLGGPLLRETYKTLSQKRITVESLFTLSMVGAFVGSLLSTIRGHGDIYYEVVAIVLAIYTIGKTLGLRSRKKALEQVDALRNEFNYVNIEEKLANNSTHLRKVHVQDLPANARVVVGPGEAIGVDGVVVAGKSYVEEAALTGEAISSTKEIGSKIFAGCHCVDGTLTIEPTAAFGQRVIDQILSTVENAQLKPSRLQTQADKLMQFFLPVVIFFSILGFLGGWGHGHWSDGVFNAMAVLLVACPCALGLATPLAIWSTLWQLSKIGLVCRNGTFLDVLNKANRFVFDKTGTLSEEGLYVDSFLITHKSTFSDEQIQGIIEAVQRSIEHPIARALRNWLQTEIDQKPLTKRVPYALTGLKMLPGLGLEATVDGPTESQSNAELQIKMGDIAAMPPAVQDYFHQIGAPQGTKKLIFISIQNEPSAYITLREKLRHGVEETFIELSKQHIASTILTGDRSSAWESIHGVTIERGISPEGKRLRVEEYQQKDDTLVFVGDGVNDAGAMSISDASIAIGGGTSLARATSDAVLMSQSLNPLPVAVRMARNMQRTIKESMVIALLYNTFGMALAAMGILHPVVASLLMLLSSAIVSWRALRTDQTALKFLQEQ
jgi:heavy metal translocating P-type ATPase